MGLSVQIKERRSMNTKRGRIRIAIWVLSVLFILGSAMPVLAWEPEKVAPDCHRYVYAYKFWDKNGDGSKNGSDVWLQGWTMKLYKWYSGAWHFVSQATTNSSGRAYLGWVSKGKYKVVEVMKSGWTNTTPTEQGFEFYSGDGTVRKYFGNTKECATYEVWLEHYDVDCYNAKTTFIYIVKGTAIGNEPALSHWSLGLCDEDDIHPYVDGVWYKTDVDCDNPDLSGGWQVADYDEKAPGESGNDISGHWSVKIDEGAEKNQCTAFKIVLDGAWEKESVPWTGKAGSDCWYSGTVMGPSCEPYPCKAEKEFELTITGCEPEDVSGYTVYFGTQSKAMSDGGGGKWTASFTDLDPGTYSWHITASDGTTVASGTETLESGEHKLNEPAYEWPCADKKFELTVTGCPPEGATYTAVLDGEEKAMSDPDGDGVYTASWDNLPAGTYSWAIKVNGVQEYGGTETLGEGTTYNRETYEWPRCWTVKRSR